MGAPQNAITASPMNLSSVPPWRKTVAAIRSRYSFSISTTLSAGSASEMEVKPRMSLKSSVTVARAPPRRSVSCSSTRRRTCSGAT